MRIDGCMSPASAAAEPLRERNIGNRRLGYINPMVHLASGRGFSSSVLETQCLFVVVFVCFALFVRLDVSHW